VVDFKKYPKIGLNTRQVWREIHYGEKRTQRRIDENGPIEG
jgi:hypothetical protein